QIVPGAAGAVGVLVAELDLVAMSLLDLDLRPVGFHLLGDDQRQAGAHASAHLRAVRDDGDDAVGRDRDAHARADHATVRHLPGASLIGEGLARHHGCGEHEAAGDTQSLQDAAAGNLLDPDMLLEATKLLWVVDEIHDHTPVDARWTAFSMR